MPGIVRTGEAGGRRQPLALWCLDGEVRAKQPSRAARARMARLARTLDARLQGDDGELHREDGSSFDPQDAAGPRAPQAPPGAGWLRRLLGRRQGKKNAGHEGPAKSNREVEEDER